MTIFSTEEIRDIAIAIAALTIIFAFPSYSNIFEWLIIVVLAFLLHELAHKFVARKYGSLAFFKAWPFGILIGLVFMLLGLKFVAPGAVVIYPYRFGRWKHPHVTLREMGIIAASGPAVNILLALIFVGLPGFFFSRLAFINAFLAFFNLLPVKPLDGSKVFAWKTWFWFAMQLISILLVIPILYG